MLRILPGCCVSRIKFARKFISTFLITTIIIIIIWEAACNHACRCILHACIKDRWHFCVVNVILGSQPPVNITVTWYEKRDDGKRLNILRAPWIVFSWKCLPDIVRNVYEIVFVASWKVTGIAFFLLCGYLEIVLK